ncbi:hypothetical protein LSTR_LSTR014934 [Laodelphax striatellus]|uniref:Uncharacterized protein n=1 Tax=Laodelphax striatellus TaxID=195883 RepID=A0A482XN11_LAOST|nr:hypothetical protein LSTR_LSTR014934 [Laodelphax striatellus]
MMSWDQRALDLDDIVAPSGYVMTGVKFRKLGTHLNLEVRMTPFNFTTGQLIKPHKKSEWISNDNTDGSDKPRKLLTSLPAKTWTSPHEGRPKTKPDSRNDTLPAVHSIPASTRTVPTHSAFSSTHSPSLRIL